MEVCISSRHLKDRTYDASEMGVVTKQVVKSLADTQYLALSMPHRLLVLALCHEYLRDHHIEARIAGEVSSAPQPHAGQHNHLTSSTTTNRIRATTSKSKLVATAQLYLYGYDHRDFNQYGYSQQQQVMQERPTRRRQLRNASSAVVEEPAR